MGFILFWSQLRKEFEKCQKLFYKIIFYIAPFCSVFQIVSKIVHLYQQSYDSSNFLKHTWYVSICHYALLLSLLPIISTVRSGIITKHIRENGNVRKNIIITKTNQNGTIFLTTQIIFIYFFSFLKPLMQLRSNEKEAKRGITTILHSSQNSNFQATSVCLFPCELLPKNSWQHR